MHQKGFRVEVWGACIVAGIALVAGVIGYRANRPPPKLRAQLPPKIIITLVEQVEAHPGEIVHVAVGNTEVFRYTCLSTDAAVAVFTAHDQGTGGALPSVIESAKDAFGKEYQAGFIPSGSANLLVIKHGFRHKPAYIAVTVGTPSLGRIVSEAVFRITKIADPNGSLPAPSQSSQGSRMAQ